MTDAVAAAVAALGRGEAVILPTDTVYGLCADAATPEPTQRLYALKGRDLSQPSALLAGDVDALLRCVPELPEAILRALLPGAYTLVLPNPARRFPWLCGTTPEAIGVRVPVLAPEAAHVVAAVGCLASTSANLHGGPDPRRVEDVAAELLAGVSAVVDVGELPGTPSTVIALTGSKPRVLREGAGPVAEALSTIIATGERR